MHAFVAYGVTYQDQNCHTRKMFCIINIIYPCGETQLSGLGSTHERLQALEQRVRLVEAAKWGRKVTMALAHAHTEHPRN